MNIREQNKEFKTINNLCDFLQEYIIDTNGVDLTLPIKGLKASKLRVESGDVFFCDQQIWEHIGKERADEIAVEAVKSGGAVALISNRKIFDQDGKELPCIIVRDPLECLIETGKHIRKQHKAKVVDITGTCGKTTTKTLIELVLQTKYLIHANNANANDVTNVFEFITLLEKDHEFYVQEVSGAGPKRAESSSAMLSPDVSVITNIGNYHLDLYKTVERLAEDKLKLVNNLSDGGVAFLNMDDDILSNVKTNSDKTIVYISEKNPTADYFIKDIIQLPEGLIITIVDNYTKSTPKEYTAKVDIIGKHNAFNIAAAFAVGQWAGVEEDRIIEGLGNYHSDGFRQVMQCAGGRNLYLDCFSITEKSAITSVETLVDLKCEGNKIAVIGGGGHFGEELDASFLRIADRIKEYSIDYLICFGNKTKMLYEGVSKHGKIKTIFVETMKELVHILKNAKANDLLLFKAGYDECLPIAVDNIFGTDIGINAGYYRRNYARRYRENKFVYMIFDCMDMSIVSLDYYGGYDRRIFIPDEIDGSPVTHVNKNAFKNKDIEGVDFGKNIIGIGENAFCNCTLLNDIKLNEGLKYIDKNAFNNCMSLKKIMIPDGVIHIGEHAFKDCKGLKEIYIPETVNYIGKGAFENCPSLKINCSKDSYAEKYYNEIYKREKSKYEYPTDATIFCAGDINIDLKRSRDDDYFKFIKFPFMFSDFSICNFESEYPSVFRKKNFEDYLRKVKECGFDLLLNNNESSFVNKYIFRDRVKSIRKNGFDCDVSDNSTDSIFIKNINGIKIAVLSYMTFSNDNKQQFKRYSLNRLKADMKTVKNAGADFVIAYMHWGNKKAENISLGQQKVAVELAESGVDVIIGTHPYKVQKCEFIKNANGKEVLCCYSLGNLHSGAVKADERESTIVVLKLKKDKDKNIKIDYGYIPLKEYNTFMNMKNCILPVSTGLAGGVKSKYFASTQLNISKKFTDLIKKIDTVDFLTK